MQSFNTKLLLYIYWHGKMSTTYCWEKRKDFTQQHVESVPVHLKPCIYVFTVRQGCLKMFTKMVLGGVSGSRILGDFSFFLVHFCD